MPISKEQIKMMIKLFHKQDLKKTTKYDTLNTMGINQV
jgi:hypothetical protein